MSTKFSPTPAELALVSQIFAQVDLQKLGILTGDVAVKTFGGANLPPAVLGEIWSIADEDNNGWLPRKGVAIAIRLMGWAQKGEKISSELVHKRRRAERCLFQTVILIPSLSSWTLTDYRRYNTHYTTNYWDTQVSPS